MELIKVEGSRGHERSVFLRQGAFMWLAAASLVVSGCAALLVGAGVAGGYAISKDSVKNVFDLPKDLVFDQSLSVVKEMGLVKVEDRAHGLIKADVQDAQITITVKPLTRKTVELKVRGRNQFWMPKVDAAQDVYSKIIAHLS